MALSVFIYLPQVFKYINSIFQILNDTATLLLVHTYYISCKLTPKNLSTGQWRDFPLNLDTKHDLHYHYLSPVWRLKI